MGISTTELLTGVPDPRKLGKLFKGKKAPGPVESDPEADADRIAAEAAVAANSDAARRRRARALSSLSSPRPTNAGAESGALSYGKTVLGG